MTSKSNSDQITDSLNELELKIARMTARRNAQIDSLQRDFIAMTSPNRSCSSYWNDPWRRRHRFPFIYSLPTRYCSADSLFSNHTIDVGSRRKFVTFNSENDMPMKCKPTPSPAARNENATLLAKLKNLVFEQERRLANQQLKSHRESEKRVYKSDLWRRDNHESRSAIGSKKEPSLFLNPISEKDNFYRRYNAFAHKILKPWRKITKTSATAASNTGRGRRPNYVAGNSGSLSIAAFNSNTRHRSASSTSTLPPTGVGDRIRRHYDDYSSHSSHRYPWCRRSQQLRCWSPPLRESFEPRHRRLGLYRRYLPDRYSSARQAYPVDIPRDVESIMRDSSSDYAGSIRDSSRSWQRPLLASTMTPLPIKYDPFESDSYLRSSLPSWKQYYYTQKLRSKPSNERFLDSYDPYYDFFLDTASLDSTEESPSMRGEEKEEAPGTHYSGYRQFRRQKSPVTPERLVDEYRDAIYEDIIRNLKNQKRRLKCNRRVAQPDEVRGRPGSPSGGDGVRDEPTAFASYPRRTDELQTKKFLSTPLCSGQRQFVTSCEFDGSGADSSIMPDLGYNGGFAAAFATTLHTFDPSVTAEGLVANSIGKYDSKLPPFNDRTVVSSVTSATTKVAYGQSLDHFEPPNCSRRPFGLLQDDDAATSIDRYAPIPPTFSRKERLVDTNKLDRDYRGIRTTDNVAEIGTGGVRNHVIGGHSRAGNSRPAETWTACPASTITSDSKCINNSVILSTNATSAETTNHQQQLMPSCSFSLSSSHVSRRCLENEDDDKAYVKGIEKYSAKDRSHRLGSVSAVADFDATDRTTPPFQSAHLEHHDQMQYPAVAAKNEEQRFLDASTDLDRQTLSKPNDTNPALSHYKTAARQSTLSRGESADLLPPASRNNSATSNTHRQSVTNSASQNASSVASVPASPSAPIIATIPASTTMTRRGSIKPMQSRKNSVTRISGSNAEERRKLLQQVNERKSSASNEHQDQQQPLLEQPQSNRFTNDPDSVSPYNDPYKVEETGNEHDEISKNLSHGVESKSISDATRMPYRYAKELQAKNPNYKYHPTGATAIDMNVGGPVYQPYMGVSELADGHGNRFDQSGGNAKYFSSSVRSNVTRQRCIENEDEPFTDNYQTFRGNGTIADRHFSRDRNIFSEYPIDKNNSTVPSEPSLEQNRRPVKPAAIGEGGDSGGDSNSETTSIQNPNNTSSQQTRPAVYNMADNDHQFWERHNNNLQQPQLESTKNEGHDSNYNESDRYRPKIDTNYERDNCKHNVDNAAPATSSIDNGARTTAAIERAFTSADREQSAVSYTDRYQQSQQQEQQQYDQYYQNESGDGLDGEYVGSDAHQSYHRLAGPLPELAAYRNENCSLDTPAILADGSGTYSQQHSSYETTNTIRPNVENAYSAPYHYEGEGNNTAMLPMEYQQEHHYDNSAWLFDQQFYNHQPMATASSTNFDPNQQMTTNNEYSGYPVTAAEYYPPNRVHMNLSNELVTAGGAGADEERQFKSVEPQSSSLNSGMHEELYLSANVNDENLHQQQQQHPRQQRDNVAESMEVKSVGQSLIKELTNNVVAPSANSQPAVATSVEGSENPSAVRESVDSVAAPRRASKATAQSSSSSSEEKRTKMQPQPLQNNEIQKRMSKIKQVDSTANKFKRTASNVNKIKMLVKKT